jgi:hypothetical protein
MTLARASIASFQRGHAFSPVSLTIRAAEVSAYLDAVGDRGVYDGAVPPLAAVAFALRSLQEVVSLPDGSLHTGQEVEHLGMVPEDQPLQMDARVAQRSERQGMVISVIEFEITAHGAPLLRARTTIIAPGEAP